MKQLMLCECGEFIENNTFKDYIKTSANPSTPTLGHQDCGFIFNFIDGALPKRYSSRKELKAIAMKFIQKKDISEASIGPFFLEVDRLKTTGNLSDGEIIYKAFENILKKDAAPL